MVVSHSCKDTKTWKFCISTWEFLYEVPLLAACKKSEGMLSNICHQDAFNPHNSCDKAAQWPLSLFEPPITLPLMPGRDFKHIPATLSWLSSLPNSLFCTHDRCFVCPKACPCFDTSLMSLFLILPFTHVQTCALTVPHLYLITLEGQDVFSFISSILEPLRRTNAKVITPLSNGTYNKYSVNINEWTRQMKNIACHILDLF